ncbi:glycosyltransferase family 2 protein [Lapillicoccus jejuensis]|uniref:Glycosyl transferase family 2 n=1 Tax=Lapillicoccus jejuensis TaxID=402171 RepID=A0A542DZ27_9MICO|nr:glycosyltransferase family 2 protein [Lapillicoccus jejuensis]TQJ08184.1 glycosyl transferase family 2 [Lapillicoccus jejuensis]
MPTTLSIVMPVYNEAATILRALDRVLAVDFPCPTELVVVDDGSSDATWALLERVTDSRVRLVRHAANRGKGAAVLTGVDHASGSHLVILDADLEYSPADIPALVQPVLDGVADHVFGVRVFGLNTRYPSFRFAVGGRATTLAANVLYDSCLTDMHTCLKLVPTSHVRSLGLGESGFGLDTELTARLLRAGVRPFEVPVSYNGRTAADGKKITWRDGVRCLAVLGRVRAAAPAALAPVHRPVRVVTGYDAPVAALGRGTRLAV